MANIGKSITIQGDLTGNEDLVVEGTVKGRIDEITPQVEHVIDLIFSTSSVRARFEGCGAVSKEDAEHLGLVGPAARGCGMPYDVRRGFPTEVYA